MPQLNLILGGANFGDAAPNSQQSYSTPEKLQPLLDLWKSKGCSLIDTAARYPPIAPGNSQRILGEVRAAQQGFTLDTKILAGAGGSLARDKILASAAQSWKSLGVEKVRTLYCHAPDFETLLEEQAKAFDDLYKEGRFEKYGVSNFPAEMLERLLKICTENNWVKPTVYQGRYNALFRAPESDLLPLCHSNGIEFVAFNIVGAGFLTGNLTAGNTKGTRYEEGNWMGTALRGVYDKEVFHEAFRKIQAAIEPHGISGVATSVRWLAHHSALTDGDGLILGSSRPKQVEEVIKFIEDGPLPQEIVEVVDSVWADIKNAGA